MTLKKALAALLLFFILSPASLAFDIPEPDGFVTDLAGVFSSSEELELENRIQGIEDSTTAEVGVLVIPTTEGEGISQLAFDVGNTWGVGKEENDNGLMILVAVEDRDWFMATGYGLEGVLPDVITKRIAENNFPHHFRASLFADGILAALDDVEALLKEDPSVIAKYTEKKADSESRSDAMIVGSFLILALFAFMKGIFVGIPKKAINKLIISSIFNAFIFFVGLWLTAKILLVVLMIFSVLMDFMLAFGGTGAGGGGSSSGGSSSSSSYGSSSSSSSSSSGGSFGGGSFGGGGSGGSW